jgi:thiol-disulfide isomerase/thioredoxin
MAYIFRGIHLNRAIVLKHYNWIALVIVAAICVSGSRLMAAAPAVANEALVSKPFYHDSLKKVEASYFGEAFLLSVWSQECGPCMKELAILAGLKDEYPKLNLVLISTDSIDNTGDNDTLLAELGHSNTVDSWIYASDQPERLRYSIDKNWFGEMPRSYFYDDQGARRAVSGLLSEATLRSWIVTSLKPK